MPTDEEKCVFSKSKIKKKCKMHAKTAWNVYIHSRLQVVFPFTTYYIYNSLAKFLIGLWPNTHNLWNKTQFGRNPPPIQNLSNKCVFCVKRIHFVVRVTRWMGWIHQIRPQFHILFESKGATERAERVRRREEKTISFMETIDPVTFYDKHFPFFPLFLISQYILILWVRQKETIR